MINYDKELGKGPDISGEDVGLPTEEQRSLLLCPSWSWSAGIANARGHPPECVWESGHSALCLGVYSPGANRAGILWRVWAVLQTLVSMLRGTREGYHYTEATKLPKDPFWPAAEAGSTKRPHNLGWAPSGPETAGDLPPLAVSLQRPLLKNVTLCSNLRRNTDTLIRDSFITERRMKDASEQRGNKLITNTPPIHALRSWAQGLLLKNPNQENVCLTWFPSWLCVTRERAITGRSPRFLSQLGEDRTFMRNFTKIWLSFGKSYH